MEVHGSIHHLQCQRACRGEVWSAEGFEPRVDEEACRLLGEPPRCPHCGDIARPNILMFGDWGWVERRTELQYQRLQGWLAAVDHLVCIEIGAGSNIATVRHFSEQQAGHLVRINPNEPEVPGNGRSIGLALGGQQGIAALVAAISG